ncbi:MAG TPA: hypothetical protein DDW94_09630 [Deltaproteobacteria bacterium]|nr:MAG: hypothetical protein A2Z79_12230 [Deltaproteobacteria bacterium GWA2_55_82]OGQ63941.1 MAG: hypothetical protein A3I81_07760 [Deltaproteobacteria bacterium RIFCSPLOWO2_02_FULL_55_12]OIJ73373.1 MAG: hypothetical protein A2V21_303300 [Deltaproteobacteria bacterium GWC2_55_46]HBG47232.1 hypothetical protein [Deltaproteobacteria bacterium]HCY09998.1 hypothetical protein [Deltaproteobacteria bacterium]
MDYTKALDTLKVRFQEKHDKQNRDHKALQTTLNDLADALKAVEFIRANPQGGDHALNVGRAAARLQVLAEAAEAAITTKATSAGASFESSLREHSGLVNGPYAVEIRQRLQGMAPGEKVKVVQAMIESRDGSSLAAIIDAPSMLTGLSSEDIGKFREQYFQTAAPDIVKARDTYRDLNEHVQAAVKTSLTAASEYSDPVKLRALELHEAEAAKAKAALGGE